MEDTILDHILSNNTTGSTTVVNAPNEDLENCQNVEEESLKKNDDDGTDAKSTGQPAETTSGTLAKYWENTEPVRLYIETIWALAVTYLKFLDDITSARM